MEILKFTLLIITLFHLTLLQKEKVCNTELIRLFNIKGRIHPKYNNHVDICGKNMDSCCTIVDELKIIKMWKEHSLVHIRFKVKEMLSAYNSIFALHDMFRALHSGLVPVHFAKERWVPYFWKSCSKVFDDENDMAMEVMSGNEGKGDQVVEKLDDTDRVLEKKREDKGVKKMSGVWKSDEDKGEKKERILRDNKTVLMMTKSEKNAIESANYIKKKFNKTIQDSVKKFHEFYQNYQNFEDIQNSLIKKKEHITNLLALSKKNPEILKSRALKMDNKIPSSDDFNLKLLNDLYNNHTKVEEVSDALEKKKNEIIQKLEEIKDFANFKVQHEKKMLMENMLIPIDNNFMGGLIRQINNNLIPEINTTLPFYPIRTRQKPFFNPISLPHYECSIKEKRLYRKFFLLNEKKYRYCDTIYGNLMNFNMNHFGAYMENIRDAMLRLNYIKKSVYCSVCDLNEQKFINLIEEKFYFKKGFCRKFVYQFKSYLEWKNIIFVEYLNNLLQYVECHQSSGANMDFPYKSGISKMMKKIYFYRRCFDNLNEEEESFKYCHFICKEFRYERMSKELEGDMEFMKDIFLRLVSFLRSQNVSIKTPFHKEMMRVTENFGDIPQFHFDEKTGDDIDKSIIKEENAILAKERYLKQKLAEAQKEKGIIIEKIKEDEDRNLSKKQEEGKILTDSELKNNPNILLLNTKPKNIKKHSLNIDNSLISPNKNTQGRILGANVPVFEYSNPLPAISDFQAVFINGNLGLNPLETDSLMKMNYEIEDYIDNYKKKHSAEPIDADVLQIVVVPKSNVDNFNEDIDIGFGNGSGGGREIAKLLTRRDKIRLDNLDQDINFTAINKKKEIVGKKKPISLAKKDGVPELDYIFN